MAKLNYGQGNAVMVLVADKMGLAPVHVDDAKKLLEGRPVHPMFGAAVESEAVKANNRLRSNASLIAEANRLAVEVALEYGFA